MDEHFRRNAFKEKKIVHFFRQSSSLKKCFVSIFVTQRQCSWPNWIKEMLRKLIGFSLLGFVVMYMHFETEKPKINVRRLVFQQRFWMMYCIGQITFTILSIVGDRFQCSAYKKCWCMEMNLYTKSYMNGLQQNHRGNSKLLKRGRCDGIIERWAVQGWIQISWISNHFCLPNAVTSSFQHLNTEVETKRRPKSTQHWTYDELNKNKSTYIIHHHHHRYILLETNNCTTSI